MGKRQPAYQTFLSAIGLGLVIIGWIVLAPPNMGGQTSYIIVVGNSMEPKFKLGDLVMVRKAAQYNIGDIVAYSQPDIGTVFHRIVGTTNDVFIMKGDNNSWNDSYHPVRQEIIGKFWAHIPGAGNILKLFKTPFFFTIIVIVFSVVIVSILLSGDNAINKKRVSGNKKMDERMDTNDNNPSDSLYIVAAVGFVALVLAFVSFSQPIEKNAEDNIEYTQKGNFEYFSDVPDDIYDTDMLRSGDPIFRQINNSININFTYEFSSTQPAEIGGTYRLLAEVKDVSGWKRTIEIIPLSRIAENSFTSSGTLDLSEVASLIDNFEEQTGVTSNRYTLTIQPEIIIAGEIDKRSFSNTFTPALNFNLDDQKLVLLESNTEDVDVLNPIESGTVEGTRKSANTISILGLDLSVLIARMISVYAIIGTIIAVLWINKKERSQKKINRDRMI